MSHPPPFPMHPPPHAQTPPDHPLYLLQPLVRTVIVNPWENTIYHLTLPRSVPVSRHFSRHTYRKLTISWRALEMIFTWIKFPTKSKRTGQAFNMLRNSYKFAVYHCTNCTVNQPGFNRVLQFFCEFWTTCTRKNLTSCSKSAINLRSHCLFKVVKKFKTTCWLFDTSLIEYQTWYRIATLFRQRCNILVISILYRTCYSLLTSVVMSLSLLQVVNNLLQTYDKLETRACSVNTT